MINAADLQIAIRVTEKAIDKAEGATKEEILLSKEILRNQITIMYALIEIGEKLEKKS